MKKLVLVCLCLGVISCDNKKALEINSTDSYEVIAAKTHLIDRKDMDNYYLYSSKDKLKSFNNIPFDQNYSDLSFEFSKDGKFCGLTMLRHSDNSFSKNDIIKLSESTKQTLGEYGTFHESYGGLSTLDWEPNTKNGIKRIETIFSDGTSAVIIITNNERYCNPEVMEQEKRGGWMTYQTTDDIDDTKTNTATTLSNSIDKGTLFLSCRKNNLYISIGVRDYLGDKDTEVAFRLDKDKAFISGWRTIPKIKSVIYKGDTKDLFRKMLKAKELTTRITTLNNSVTLKFDLDKIDYATQEIVKSCDVNSSMPSITNTTNRPYISRHDSENVTTAWAIQVVSVDNLKIAESFVDNLRKASYNSYLRSNGSMHRVFVGPFIDKAEAINTQKQINKQFNEKAILLPFKPERIK